MGTVNKEKMLFLAVLVVSFFYFSRYCLKQEKKEIGSPFDAPKKEASLHLLPRLNVVRPGTSETSRSPFHKVSEKQKLPPVELPLPEPEGRRRVVLPPIPSPRIDRWDRFPLQPFKPLPADAVVPLEEAGKWIEMSKPNSLARRLEAFREVDELAHKLKSMVQEKDILMLKNGSLFEGKIIGESEQEIILRTSEHKIGQSLTFPRPQIGQIKRKMTMEEVCLQTFKSLNLKDNLSLLHLANACGKLNEEEVAERMFRTLLDRFPYFTEGYLAYGDYFLERLKIEEAYRIYILAAQRKADTEESRLQMARIESLLGLDEKALETIGIPSRGDSFDIALSLAFSTRNLGLFNQILEKASIQGGKEGQMRNVERYWRARMAFDRGEIQEAIEICNQTQDKNSPALNRLKGAALYLAGNLTEASRDLTMSAREGDMESLYNLALVYFEGGALSNAAELLKKLKGSPRFVADPSFLLAVLGYLSDVSPTNDEASEGLLKLAFQANPENIFVLCLLGEIKERKGLFQEAYQTYQQAISLDFSFSHAPLRLGMLSIKSGNAPDAIRYLNYTRSLVTSPSQKVEIHASMALANLLAENTKEAEIWIREALQVDPGNILAWKLRAWMHNKSGETSQSLSSLEKILAKNPGDRYASEARDQIAYNDRLSLWQDTFVRPNGERVRRRWEETEQDGIEITLRDHKLIFSGQNIEGNIPSTLLRESLSENFVAISAEFLAEEAKEACCGLVIRDSKAALFFGKDSQRRLVCSIFEPSGTKNVSIVLQEGVPVLWPEKDPVQLKIERKRTEKNQYRLLLDARPIGQFVFPPLKSEKIKVGAYAFSTVSSYWKCKVNYIQIVEKQ